LEFLTGGFVVIGGTARVEGELGIEIPTRGGGINWESVGTVEFLEVCNLWALLRAGNAGGESSSSFRSVSVSSPSSSEAGGEITSIVGTEGGD
jgi:hypothetical protein